MKTFIVPQIHTLEFGCEVRIEANNAREAAMLARRGNGEIVGDGYDWDRQECVRIRKGNWQKVREEKS